MFETYRMLGSEREAELLREAERLHALPPSRAWTRLAASFARARRAAWIGWNRAERCPTATEAGSRAALE